MNKVFELAREADFPEGTVFAVCVLYKREEISESNFFSVIDLGWIGYVAGCFSGILPYANLNESFTYIEGMKFDDAYKIMCDLSEKNYTKVLEKLEEKQKWTLPGISPVGVMEAIHHDTKDIRFFMLGLDKSDFSYTVVDVMGTGVDETFIV